MPPVCCPVPHLAREITYCKPSPLPGINFFPQQQ
jgi:hypothetical protein